jgi:hypothetical protein
VSLVSSSCPWLVLAPKVFQLCTNHLVLVLCRHVWVSEACQFFLVPSLSFSTPFYPSKVLRAKERAWFLLFRCFLFGTHIWVPQGVRSASIDDKRDDEDLRGLKSSLESSQCVCVRLICLWMLLICISWEGTLIIGNPEKQSQSIELYKVDHVRGLWFFVKIVKLSMGSWNVLFF